MRRPRPQRSQRPPIPSDARLNRMDGDPRILEPGEHPIVREQIDPQVLGVIDRLGKAGFLTWIVGGAVRDLLMGRLPKDFDLVTSARPEQIRRLFQHARIIGRRFRLVLLRIGDLEIEVSTFRAPTTPRSGRGPRHENRYGTPNEDMLRRDFGVNALAYDARTGCVIDYVGGLEDLERRQIRTISPPETSFREDPVRMLRAVRFQVRLGFDLHPGVEKAIRKMAGRLHDAKRHRLAEETQRFLTGGQAEAVFAAFRELGLLGPLLGLEAHPDYFRDEALDDPFPVLLPYLQSLDAWAAAGGEPVSPTVALLGLLITLSRPELVASFTNDPLPPGAKLARVRVLRRRAPEWLGDWGLLKGQVAPALQILAIARTLLRGRERAASTHPRLEHDTARPGTREAWWLLILLQPVLGLSDAFLEPGRRALPELRPLPILDHHQPWRVRAATPAHLRSPVTPARDLQRRKRRRRRKPRRREPREE